MFHISKVHPLECQVYGQSHRGERDLRRLQTSFSPILIQFKNIQIIGMSFESLNLYFKMFFETIIYKCIRFKEPQGCTTLGDLRPRNKVIQSFRLGFCILGMFQVCSCFFFFVQFLLYSILLLETKSFFFVGYNGVSFLSSWSISAHMVILCFLRTFPHPKYEILVFCRQVYWLLLSVGDGCHLILCTISNFNYIFIIYLSMKLNMVAKLFLNIKNFIHMVQNI